METTSDVDVETTVVTRLKSRLLSDRHTVPTVEDLVQRTGRVARTEGVVPLDTPLSHESPALVTGFRHTEVVDSDTTRLPSDHGPSFLLVGVPTVAALVISSVRRHVTVTCHEPLSNIEGPAPSPDETVVVTPAPGHIVEGVTQVGSRGREKGCPVVGDARVGGRLTPLVRRLPLPFVLLVESRTERVVDGEPTQGTIYEVTSVVPQTYTPTVVTVATGLFPDVVVRFTEERPGFLSVHLLGPRRWSP